MKTLLGSALALVVLSACSVDEAAETQQLNAVPVSLFDPVAASAVVPFPFDAFFAGFNDPTLNVPNPRGAPFVTAANQVDGFSTTSSIFTDLLGEVDFDSVTRGLIVINTATGQPLVPGVDYSIQDYPAVDDADGVPINAKRSRILIQPLRPLMPETRYVVALTRGIVSTAGNPAEPSALFLVAASGTPVSEQTAPVLTTLTEAQRQTMEVLRSQIIRPTVQGLAAAGIPESSLVLAWPFTTQSIGKSLRAIQANTQPSVIGAQPVPGPGRPLNTGDLGLGLPPVADIYAGFFDTTYYLATPSAEAPTAPLETFWQADPSRPDTEASFLGQVPCGAFAVGAPLPGGQTAQPSASTTTCFPVPVARSTQRVPMLVTVPNANSGRSKPADGWPVVIFQHGITRNRSDMFAIAPALAAAGFVVVAIDHPLHGITLDDGGTAMFRSDSLGERTFDVDYIDNATGAPGPDGQVDPSGAHFLNLSSLLTARDNLRQSVSDLIGLSTSVANLELDGDPDTVDVNPARLAFLGHSLGGIVGTTLLGVDDRIGAATLAMPGGGIAKLLDGSLAFGPRVAAGLAAAGINEGGDTFETFLRFAQLTVDTTDPINHAAAARANHPIHMIEVIGDQVVPNRVDAGPTDSDTHLVTIDGPLSGTDPLYMRMGLDVVDNVEPGVTQDLILATDATGVGAVVRFTAGDHGSILDPTASLAATVEMQTETANFLGSGGVCLPIGQNCPQP